MKEKSSRPNDMGACVSHGSSIASGDDSASSSFRLREQRQGSTGESGPNSTSPSCRLHCQVQSTTALSPQKRNSNTSGNKQRQLQQHHGLPRSRRDNFCLWWCCCCKCSHKCLANVGQGTAGALRGGTTGLECGGVGGGVDVGLLAELLGNELGNDLNTELDKVSMDEIQAWGESFDRLMHNPVGRKLFKVFCVSEYSDENIAFWLACEQLKTEQKPDKIEEKARTIYDNYISIISPKEVSLDSRVRDIVNRNMTQPTPHTFDEAQLQIYTLMHRDSYPRFINSEIYRRVAKLGQTTSNKQQTDASIGPLVQVETEPLDVNTTTTTTTTGTTSTTTVMDTQENRKTKKSIS